MGGEREWRGNFGEEATYQKSKGVNVVEKGIIESA